MMNKYCLNALLLVILFSVCRLSAQGSVIGKFVIQERNFEPIKLVEIFFYNKNDSIFFKSQTDCFGFFTADIDTNEISKIKAYHPLFGTSLIYEKVYNNFIFNDTLLIKIAFDYPISRRGEAKYYTNIDNYLLEKNAKCLDLKNQKLEYIPKLKKLRKHGVLGLFLEDNHLTLIPNKLFKIKGLAYLDLTNNPLNVASMKLIDKWKKKGILIIY